MNIILFIKKSKAAVIVTILCLIGMVAVLILPPPPKEIEFPFIMGINLFGGIGMLALYVFLEHRSKRKVS